MILVIMGGTDSKRNAVIKDLMSLYASRVQTLTLDHIPEASARLERLMLEFERPMPFRMIRIVNNPTSVVEVQWLRRQGAFFAHVYGKIGKIYAHIEIKQQDVMVYPLPHRQSLPFHVHTPEEAVSKFMLVGRNEKVA
ncbi:hypothetical protein [Vibrio sp. H11]|uniref:hypothetical protein n=1 Tax=Vibrio sp. H11 TaxID=2565928 RepID=UPI0010A6812A|nr:hypothetical protein [Vibrio sp. H11]